MVFILKGKIHVYFEQVYAEKDSSGENKCIWNFDFFGESTHGMKVKIFDIFTNYKNLLVEVLVKVSNNKYLLQDG